MLEKISQTILMSEGTSLFLKALGGIATGLLVGTGHLDANNQDAFSQNIQVATGAIVTIISAWVLLEHAFIAAKEEIKWNYSPDAKTPGSALPAKPEVIDPTSQPPAQPAA